MMQYVLASGPTPLEHTLAVVGQIAGFILVLELLLFIVLAVAINGALAFGFAWIREKAELIKKLRPTVDSVNATGEAAMKGTLTADGSNNTIKLPAQTAHTINSIAQTVKQLPARANTVEEKVEQGSDRVAQAVIEFRARTVMVQTVVKAFFLPGLTTNQRRLPAPENLEVKMLPEDRTPALEAPAGAGDGRLLKPATPVASSSGSEPVRTAGS
jgi:hypothetical protein